MRIALLAICLVAFAVPAQAQPIRLGGNCDRTAATRLIGVEMCPGVADYIALVNRKGGIAGRKLEYTELEHAYMPDRAQDAHARHKQSGVVAVFNYGVPILYSLTPRYMADRIPAIQPGTGRSDAIDGLTWPYIFPGTASYWSQAGAAMKFIRDSGAKKGARIAFLYLDSPAGREGMPVLETIAQREGYVLHPLPVQPPGADMESQVREIASGFKADWVITSLFGQAPAVSIREFRKARFPLNRVIAFVYGAGEADVEAVGWEEAQGYLGLQFTALGRSHPVIQDVMRMYRDEGKEVPKFVGSAYYNRGVLTGAILVEGIRLAIAKHGMPLDGDKVRRGLESISKFDLGGFAPPLTFTPQDHEGGGYLRVTQVRGREWVPVGDWMRGYRDDVMAQVKKANAK
jgi:branched-chain amino acid transport system substrate-binding protein